MMSLVKKYITCGILCLSVSACQTHSPAPQSAPQQPAQGLIVIGVGSDFQFSDAVVELAAKQNTKDELLAFEALIEIAQEDAEWQGFEINLLKKLVLLKDDEDLTYYHYSAPYADLVKPSRALAEKIKSVLETIE